MTAMEETPKPTGPKRGGRLALYLVGLAVVCAAGVGALYTATATTKAVTAARAELANEAANGPRVQVTEVRAGPTFREITLLGDAKPYATATLFAKVSGYLKSISVDKGDNVRAGQILAEIDGAELDSQLQGAVADMQNKRRLALRSRELARTGSTSVQTMEQADATSRMAEEVVRNLGTMRSYTQLRAPFDGTVTARFADPGALMQAATTNQASSLPVLNISDNTRLRIGIYVEQRDVAAVHVGDEAKIIDAANPERTRIAKVSRSAGILDPRTRTLYLEIDLDNRDQFLVAGSYVNVVLRVPVAARLQIPVAALIQRGGTSTVGAVGGDGSVRFVPIKVAATDGIVVSVTEGVRAGDRVALNLPSEVAEGGRVRAVAALR